MEPNSSSEQAPAEFRTKNAPVGSQVDKYLTWRAQTQVKLEELNQKLNESKETQERQRHILLQSQMSLEQVSHRFDLEQKNRSQSMAKVQHTLHVCQILQEHCKALHDAFTRLAIEKSGLEEILSVHKSSCDRIAGGLEKVLVAQEQENNLKLLEEQEEGKVSSEMKVIQEEYKTILSNEQILLNQLNVTLSQKEKMREELQIQLMEVQSKLLSMEEESVLRHSLLKELEIIENNIINLHQINDEAEKKLLERKDQNSLLIIESNKKKDIVAALALARESEENLPKLNAKLEEEIQMVLKLTEEMRENHSKIVEEQTATINQLRLSITTVRKEIECAERAGTTQISKLQEELQKQELLIIDIQTQLSTSSQLEEILLKQIENLKQELTTVKENKEKLKQKITTLQDSSCSVDDQNLNKSKIELEAQLEQANAQNELLKSEQDNLADAMDLQMNELNVLNEKSESLENTIVTSETAVKQLEIELSNLKLNFEEALKKEEIQKRDIFAQTEMIRDLRNSVDNMKATLADNKEKAEIKMQALKSEISELQSAHEEALRSLQASKESLQMYDNECRSLTSEQSTLQSALTEKEKTMKVLENKFAQEKEKHSQLEEVSQLNASQKERRVKELQSSNDDIISNNAKLKEKLSKVQEDLKSKSSELINIREQTENFLKEQQKIKLEKEESTRHLAFNIETLTEELSRVKEDIRVTQLNDREEQELLEHDREEFKGYESQLLVICTEVCQSEEKLKEARESSNKMKTAKIASEEKVLQLSSGIESLQAAVKKAKEDIEKEKELFLRDLKKLNKTLEDRDAEVYTLKQQLLKEEKQTSLNTQEFDEVEKRKKQAANMLDELNRGLEDLLPKVTQSENDFEVLQSQFRHLEDKRAKFMKATERARKLLKDEEKKRGSSVPAMFSPDRDSSNTKSVTSSQEQALASSASDTSLHSILKPPNPPTTQSMKRSVSFAYEDDTSSSSSVILEPEDAEAIEHNPARVREIVEKRKAIQMAARQMKKSRHN